MVANLLDVAGVDHVITIDLHASQMQGFFHCPIDNLIAEPLLAQWIRVNVPDWRRAVVVSKNPGGTKRVTSLADALKLNFGIVMTDRRRPASGRTSVAASTILERPGLDGGYDGDYEDHAEPLTNGHGASEKDSTYGRMIYNTPLITPPRARAGTGNGQVPPSPLHLTTIMENHVTTLLRVNTAPSAIRESEDETSDDEADPVSDLASALP